jgi:hypothetical protein
MTILSIFRTDIPMTSYRVTDIASWTARTGSVENMRSISLTACLALSAASATIHAPEGRTGTGWAFLFVLMMRTFIISPDKLWG